MRARCSPPHRRCFSATLPSAQPVCNGRFRTFLNKLFGVLLTLVCKGWNLLKLRSLCPRPTSASRSRSACEESMYLGLPQLFLLDCMRPANSPHHAPAEMALCDRATFCSAPEPARARQVRHELRGHGYGEAAPQYVVRGMQAWGCPYCPFVLPVGVGWGRYRLGSHILSGFPSRSGLWPYLQLSSATAGGCLYVSPVPLLNPSQQLLPRRCFEQQGA